MEANILTAAGGMDWPENISARGRVGIPIWYICQPRNKSPKPKTICDYFDHSLAAKTQERILMNGFAAVVTHHKTGTVWMQATFRQIATKLGIRFVRVHTDDIVPAEELAAPIIFFERSGKFREYPGLFGDPRLKILHLIRDPRDVVISGMHYHRTSREEWLHQPSDRFEGRTYQSEINGLATDRARYVFEMNNRAASAIRTMLRWYEGDRSNAVECKYEDLIQDVDMVVFTRAATHLGFSGQELEVCRKAFW